MFANEENDNNDKNQVSNSGDSMEQVIVDFENCSILNLTPHQLASKLLYDLSRNFESRMESINDPLLRSFWEDQIYILRCF